MDGVTYTVFTYFQSFVGSSVNSNSCSAGLSMLETTGNGPYIIATSIPNTWLGVDIALQARKAFQVLKEFCCAFVISNSREVKRNN